MNVFQKRLNQHTKQSVKNYSEYYYNANENAYYKERKYLKQCHKEVCEMYGCSVFSLDITDKKNRNNLNERGKINYNRT